jgi:branched-subunit amino acid aminotransferase/4-amino-4-deoxychorismate lyase
MAIMIWVNGKFRDDAHAVLAWHDLGVTLGATVVDNCRVWGDHLFRWSDHVERFERDCSDCGIDLPFDEINLETEMEAVARRLLDGRLDMHVVTFATPDTCAMMVKPADFHRNRRLYHQGAALVVAGHFSTTADSLLPPRVKHRSRLHWHVAQTIARRRDRHAMAVLLDRPGGTLTETAISNLLAVKGGRVLLPPRDKVLDGIGLRVTLEFCERMRLPVIETELTTDGDYDELLLTGSSFGICGVASLDDRTWPVPSPITKTLMDAWSGAVGQVLDSESG